MSNSNKHLQIPPLDTFALYLHIPFCVTKCPYCDFNSFALKQDYVPGKKLSEEDSYVEALCREIDNFGNCSDWKGKRITSIFFGGGTPSLLSAASISKILNQSKLNWQWDDKIEVSMECNPGTLRESLGLEKLCGFQQAGVNRFSFGAQSIRSNKLSALGRLHNVEDVYHSLEAARKSGVSRISIDLMYGLPQESADDWSEELLEVLKNAPSHISAYNLTIEPGTEFARRQRKGIIQQAAEEEMAQMYQDTQEILLDTSYHQYEVSNFAKEGQECRHNLSYWRWESFLGLGAGAHSFKRREPSQDNLPSTRWVSSPKPAHYVERMMTKGCAQQRHENLSLEQEKLEVLYCFLRTSYGFPVKEFDAFFGESFIKLAEPVLAPLLSDGLLSYDSNKITLTHKGYLFSDHILGELASACTSKAASL